MDDTRENLLLAAGKVFADKGYEKATVREICKAAGVSNLAAVNYYFGDKERLYIEARQACSSDKGRRSAAADLGAGNFGRDQAARLFADDGYAGWSGRTISCGTID